MKKIEKYYKGGVRAGSINATFPFGFLNFEEGGICVGWNFLGFKMQKHFSYQEIKAAEPCKGLFSKGVLIKTESEKIIFWTRKTNEILKALAGIHSV